MPNENIIVSIIIAEFFKQKCMSRAKKFKFLKNKKQLNRVSRAFSDLY